MPMRREEVPLGRRFAMPVLLIIALLAIHWLVSDWPAIPHLITATFASIH